MCNCAHKCWFTASGCITGEEDKEEEEDEEEEKDGGKTNPENLLASFPEIPENLHTPFVERASRVADVIVLVMAFPGR